MLVSLIMTISAFVFVPTVEVQPYERTADGDSIIVVKPFPNPVEPPVLRPPTKRPLLPPIAIPGNDSTDNAVTIDPTDFTNFHPGQINVPVQPYWAVQIPPKPLKTPPPQYPPLPLQAGIEGICVIQGVVDTLGRIVNVKVFKSSGNTLLDEAALIAFKTYEFEPALQHDQPVAVWIRMPIKFKLK